MFPVALTVLVETNTPDTCKLPPVTVPVALTVLVETNTPDTCKLPPVTVPAALIVLVDIVTPDANKLPPVILPVAEIVVALVFMKLPKVATVTLKVPPPKSTGATVTVLMVVVSGKPDMLVVAIVVP
jgi:hypothetical protein